MAELHLTKETFETQVRNAGGVALIDFWAPWCGPCKMFSPILEQLANEIGDTALVGKVNIDDEPDLAAEFGVMSIPTVILFKDGKEAERRVGLQPKQELINWMQNI